jgi:hypothetical protein
VLQAQDAFRPPQRRPVAAPPLARCAQAGAYDARSAVGYCPPTNTVTWARSLLAEAHLRLGDFASGAALSEGWGRAAQTQARLPVEGQQAGLQRDCFTGAWVADLAANGFGGVLLSPGDLDEALITVLADSFTYPPTRPGRGDAFTRTQALRRGLLNGLTACR